MLPETVFSPPYLRYDRPADAANIKTQINRLTAEVARAYPAPATALPVNLAERIKEMSTSSGPARATGSTGVREAAATLAFGRDAAATSPQPPVQPGGRRAGPLVEVAAPSAAKIASDVSVTPNGTVPLGFNCRRTFTATANLSNVVTHTVWNLLMKDPATGKFEQIFFMGGISTVTKKSDIAKIKFDHDFSTYRDSAYASSNKTAVFVVECRPYCLFDELAPSQTEEVTLDFTATSCIGIHSVALSTNSVTGGANGQEPVLTVALDAPAGPGGQEVALSVNNTNLGNIMGSGSFVIPQGQTSGQISWFLGTRRVYSTGKSITIKAELVSPGGNSGPAYATVSLTKQ